MEIAKGKRNIGIQRLIHEGRKAFRRAENLNYYSEKDFKAAEKLYIKLCVIGQSCVRSELRIV